MSASSVPARPHEDLSAVLVLHRPRALGAGALRRIRIYLDDRRIVDLRYGATVSVSAEEGPHLLRARCRPLIGTAIPFVLGAREVLHVTVCAGALDELEIRLDEASSNEKPVA
jgi:hypothetical protein